MKSTTYQPLVSIVVIDYKLHNPDLEACLEAIQLQTYTDYEIILVTDYPNVLQYPKLRKKSYGHYVGPAEKRDAGAKMAKGEILAFIDDDAYPSKLWLRYLVQELADSQVVGVGGPGVTPPDVAWLEAASGWVSASPLGAGLYTYRFLPQARRLVDDYPSMNLAVRREDFLKIGGFDSHYWPGEDTKLCLDLVYKLDKKIVYQPKALVYHHRRPLWMPHLRQHGNFGLHRGYFARILPRTSLRPIYLAPPLLVLGVGFLSLSLNISHSIVDFIRSMAMWGLGIYLLGLGGNGWWIYRHSGSLIHGLVAVPAVLLTHSWYGVKFLQGFLLTKKLSR